jgi:hypothetical protein
MARKGGTKTIPTKCSNRFYRLIRELKRLLIEVIMLSQGDLILDGILLVKSRKVEREDLKLPTV